MKLILFLLPLLASALPSPDANLDLDTRAPTLCSTCSPFPEENKCHPTTSCVYNWGHQGPNGPYYCACRHGYKANPREVGADPSAQWRLQWPSQEGRVFVRPGIKCDTLCDNWEQGAAGCREVYQNPYCT
ncbi:hypothetical protein W97_01756 [Coniosporium apollinis CBS 100218]|uniref:EGF-like calcium-binding domain-containing protein n=1 Tax=Coniosporium apollinis (strain CBS 100218) TaxID=1168221 RepID=R7YKX5_CONA1|nr:uncharacterized protein W97_01756 [Coniosporium apollinis CBS 100218]EON62533.1 hypothetical protein W97_01756 [Coniosporium apollinis CBS 100218]